MRAEQQILQLDKHADPDAQRAYGEALAAGTAYKLPFFARNIIDRVPPVDGRDRRVLDVGSCTGALSHALQVELYKRFGQEAYRFIHADMDAGFLQQAKVAPIDARLDASRHMHVAANVIRLPLEPNTVDVAIASSAFHEVYSYDAPPFSDERIIRFFKELKRVLVPGGYVLNRDYVAQPPNKDENVVMICPTTDGLHEIGVKAAQMHNIDRLSTHARVARFLHEFGPAEDFLDQVETGFQSFRLPAWLAAEAMFHLQYTDNESMWRSEIPEHYGFADYQETKDWTQAAGLEVVAVQTVSHYDQQDRVGVRVIGPSRRRVGPEYFPTTIYNILKSPGELEQ